jgi:hypothetical protein
MNNTRKNKTRGSTIPHLTMVGQVLPGSGKGAAAGFGEHVETQIFFISWITITCTKKICITECQTTTAGLLKVLIQAI